MAKMATLYRQMRKTSWIGRPERIRAVSAALSVCGLFFLLSILVSLHASENAESIRVIAVEGQEGQIASHRLQTAIHILRKPDSEKELVVIPLVHFAPSEYYESISPWVEGASLVLYEGGFQDAQDEELDENTLFLRDYFAKLIEVLGWVGQNNWERSHRDGRWVNIDLPADQQKAAFEALGESPVSQEMRRIDAQLEEALKITDEESKKAVREQLVRFVFDGLRREATNDNKNTEHLSELETFLRPKREEVFKTKIQETLSRPDDANQCSVAVCVGAIHADPLVEWLVEEKGYTYGHTYWLDHLIIRR